MLGMAVRHDALAMNPVQQDVTHPPGEVRDPVTDARGPQHRPQGASRVDGDAASRTQGVRRHGRHHRPDAGDRSADRREILALRWADVTLDAERANLTVNGTIKTEPGKSTYRKPSPKSDSSVRTVVLPDFAVAVLRRRHGTTTENPHDAVFSPGTAPGSRSTTSSGVGGRFARTPVWTGPPRIRSARRWRP